MAHSRHGTEVGVGPDRRGSIGVVVDPPHDTAPPVLHGGSIHADPTEEFLNLGISVIFLVGLLSIGPLFRMYARLAEDLWKAQSELEQRVLDRTAELAATNESLQQERYLLHTLMDYLPHNIYFKDADSRFIRVNKAMARYIGLSDPNEAIGKTDLDFFTDEHGLQAMADEKEILRTGQGIVTKIEKETWPDGRTTWASSTKLPLLDDEEHIVGTFGISQDVTAQMQDAEALRAAKETAEAASRAKSTFLANMSHEIRTPLNAVIGMTELVLKSQLSAQQREYLSTVRDSGEALLSVINDILDFSKIEAEKLVLERERFHFRESLGDTMKSFALRAHQQGLELACYIHREVPTWVVGDYCRLRQVIVNLVNNAIKFTKRGEVVVEVARNVARESYSEEEVQLHFTVSDTGIGIPADKHAAVFDMFEQADSSTTRRHGGTGLGLAIAAKLVALMGGKIWLESELGRGSHFHFTACLGRVEAEPAEQNDVEPVCLHGMRALVVDDNATNRRILDEVLASWQMVPTCVETAGEALELMRQAQQDGRPFQLVLTDAHMPEVDGFMLAGDIRKQYQAAEPVIMMLTSGDRPTDIAECERLGIASYLLKPIKQSELLEAIQLSLGLTGPRTPLAAAAHVCQCRPLKILLAEDSLVNQQLAVALLSGEGHEVVVANNGREAVAAVETGAFDMVLMDVQMPEMDGLEATAIIRRNEAAGGGRRLPIIAMTAHALAGDRERCIDAGMDGYTSKPINADELFAAIKDLAAGQSEPSPPAASVDGDPVDWDAALKVVRGDQRLLTMIVATALGEIPELLAAVRGAVTGGDPQALRRAAHTIKGSVRYFGANRMTELAARLEGLAEKENFHAARETLPALGDASDELIASLASHVASSNRFDQSRFGFKRSPGGRIMTRVLVVDDAPSTARLPAKSSSRIRASRSSTLATARKPTREDRPVAARSRADRLANAGRRRPATGLHSPPALSPRAGDLDDFARQRRDRLSRLAGRRGELRAQVAAARQPPRHGPQGAAGRDRRIALHHDDVVPVAERAALYACRTILRSSRRWSCISRTSVVALGLCGESDRIRMGVGLGEALANAMFHGNLELSSSLRETDANAYHRLAQERRRQSPYQERHTEVQVRMSPGKAEFVIRDQGKGFNPASLPDPTDPANLDKITGRGILLMRSFMDEVSFNDKGNEVTMIKRRSGSGKAEK